VLSATHGMRYFIYCRKSSESEDRQVLSIDSQLDELQRKFAGDPEIEIVEVFRESYSAKAPGRPIFDSMLARIERGDADGIVAWHPDRLARNAVDGGRIIHLLDRKVLLDLKFATSSFENNPQGKFMLSIIFGYSKYYVDNLSENVKRGMRAKLQRGWQPNLPPIGYRNEPTLRTIVPDDRAFPVIKKLFEAAVTGFYSLAELERMLRVQWGFRTPRRRRTGGGPLSYSSVFSMFSNPFYAGYIRWSGQLYPGKHEPIITWDQYERLQVKLGRADAARPQKHRFSYTGLIRCGRCALMVTAENKINRYGSRYVYYHCTKRNVGERCKEPSIELGELERQAIAKLLDLFVPEDVVRRGLEQVRNEDASTAESIDLQRSSLEKAIRDCDTRIKVLVDLRVRDLIDDHELISRRAEIERERISLADNLSGLSRWSDWFEPVSTVILFGSRAAGWFAGSDGDVRRMILKTVSSNLTLRAKELTIEAAFPYSMKSSGRTSSGVCRLVKDVRTRYLNRDPQILNLIDAIASVEKMLPEHLKPGHEPQGEATWVA
jgi:site-specific DNA recombinase